MKKLCYFLAFILFCSCSSVAYAAQSQAPSPSSSAQQAQPAASAPSTTTPSAAAQQTPPQRITAYTLPPDRYKKAHDLGRIYFRFADQFLLRLGHSLAVLRWKLAPKYRTLAEGISSIASSGARLCATADSDYRCPRAADKHLPALALAGYGISIQGWPSWLWDWTKGEIISVIISSILIWILYAIIRKALGAGGSTSSSLLCPSACF
jgi:hypothetical protein